MDREPVKTMFVYLPNARSCTPESIGPSQGDTASGSVIASMVAAAADEYQSDDSTEESSIAPSDVSPEEFVGGYFS